jgi:hypothetical protein
MLLKSPFKAFECPFSVFERTFNDFERTFNVFERRFNIAEYRKTNRCYYFFSRAPMLMISVSKTIYR